MPIINGKDNPYELQVDDIFDDQEDWHQSNGQTSGKRQYVGISLTRLIVAEDCDKHKVSKEEYEDAENCTFEYSNEFIESKVEYVYLTPAHRDCVCHVCARLVRHALGVLNARILRDIYPHQGCSIPGVDRSLTPDKVEEYLENVMAVPCDPNQGALRTHLEFFLHSLPPSNQNVSRVLIGNNRSSI